MKILVVEDDHPIASILRMGLTGAQYAVDVAEDGPTGLRMAQEGGYALLILDVMLPGLDGWSICQALRAAHDTTPILMLTARDSVGDRIHGLELGADDYLAKPFNFGELLARVQALLRRNHVQKGRLVQVADLEIDTTRCRVTRAGAEVVLSRRECALLEALAAQEGQVLSPAALDAWTVAESGEAASLDADMARLREKIDAGRAEPLIQRLEGGYALRVPLLCEQAA
jgi:DNA-binding response OmpR family regulator